MAELAHTRTEAQIIIPRSAVVLRPGDRVLVTLDRRDARDQQHTAKLVADLERRFPGCEFTILVGATHLGVMGAGNGQKGPSRR